MKYVSLLLLAGAMALPACRSTDPSTLAASSAPVFSTPAPVGPTPNALRASYTDAQVLHTFITANQGEVLTNGIGQERARMDSIRAFSQRMVAEHEQTRQQAVALGQRLGMAPEANALSGQLDAMANATAERLRVFSPVAFDHMHIRSQVGMHELTLALLNNTLIPNARNPELAAMLRQASQVVAGHLDHARMLDRSTMVGGRRLDAPMR